MPQWWAQWSTADPCADLNNDARVNIIDASIIGLNCANPHKNKKKSWMIFRDFSKNKFYIVLKYLIKIGRKVIKATIKYLLICGKNVKNIYSKRERPGIAVRISIIVLLLAGGAAGKW